MPQKQASPRIRRRFLVEWQSRDDVQCTGFTNDISPTGGFVRSSSIPKVGEKLAMWLLVPQGGKLRLRCKVVRSQYVPQNLRTIRPSGFGIKLIEAPEEYFQLLANLFHLSLDETAETAETAETVETAKTAEMAETAETAEPVEIAVTTGTAETAAPSAETDEIALAALSHLRLDEIDETIEIHETAEAALAHLNLAEIAATDETAETDEPAEPEETDEPAEMPRPEEPRLISRARRRARRSPGSSDSPSLRGSRLTKEVPKGSRE